jgi:hypothetical protein
MRDRVPVSTVTRIVSSPEGEYNSDSLAVKAIHHASRLKDEACSVVVTADTLTTRTDRDAAGMGRTCPQRLNDFLRQLNFASVDSSTSELNACSTQVIDTDQLLEVLKYGEDLVSLFMRDDAEKEAEDEVYLVNERPRIFLLSGTV